MIERTHKRQKKQGKEKCIKENGIEATAMIC